MAIWFIFALMTGLAIAAVLWPLSRRQASSPPQVDERRFYEQRLAEIDRDLAAGFIGPAEAEAARAEAARRLLAESRAAAGDAAGARAAAGDSEYALRRRRAASAIALSAIPLLTLAIYGAVGSPDLPSLPVAERQAAPLSSLREDELVARMERRLAARPDDGEGWELIAPVYQRLGRASDAVSAWAKALRLRGETPQRLARYGEALVIDAGGVVGAPARQAFEKALAAEPGAPMPRYYLAIARAQDGDVDGALAAFRALLADAPADASWRGAVEERMRRLERRAAAGAIAAAPEEEQKAAIASMVEGLAARLRQNPDDPDGWIMLVRSWLVLGRKEEAAAAIRDARAALAGRPEALAAIDRLQAEAEKASAPDAVPAVPASPKSP